MLYKICIIYSETYLILMSNRTSGTYELWWIVLCISKLLLHYHLFCDAIMIFRASHAFVINFILLVFRFPKSDYRFSKLMFQKLFSFFRYDSHYYKWFITCFFRFVNSDCHFSKLIIHLYR